MWHSKSYHQFFEGYSERSVVDPATGKAKTERYYTGNYYEPRLTARGKKLRRLEYGLLYLASFACFAVTGFLPADNNHRLPSIFLMLADLVGLVWMLLAMFTYLTAGEKLTEGEYRERENLKTQCMGLTVLFGVTAVARLGCMVWYRQLASLMDWLTVVGSVADGAILYWMRRREKNLSYTRTLSTVKAPPDSYDIIYHAESPDDEDDE